VWQLSTLLPRWSLRNFLLLQVPRMYRIDIPNWQKICKTKYLIDISRLCMKQRSEYIDTKDCSLLLFPTISSFKDDDQKCSLIQNGSLEINQFRFFTEQIINISKSPKHSFTVLNLFKIAIVCSCVSFI